MWEARIDMDRRFFNFGLAGAIAVTFLSWLLLLRLLPELVSGGMVRRPAAVRGR